VINPSAANWPGYTSVPEPDLVFAGNRTDKHPLRGLIDHGPYSSHCTLLRRLHIAHAAGRTESAVRAVIDQASQRCLSVLFPKTRSGLRHAVYPDRWLRVYHDCLRAKAGSAEIRNVLLRADTVVNKIDDFGLRSVVPRTIAPNVRRSLNFLLYLSPRRAQKRHCRSAPVSGPSTILAPVYSQRCPSLKSTETLTDSAHVIFSGFG